VLDRSSPRAAKLEGFELGAGVLAGDPDVQALEFRERGLSFRVPRELGQKTGFYLDQRPLRERIQELAAGCRTFDAFTFIGAMSLCAARGGASSVDAIDSSALALTVAAECAELNGLTARVRFERADAAEALAAAGRRGGYDLVLCDPPKLAPTRSAQKAALTSMRRLAANACRATRPGGRLVLSSCSAALGLADLTRVLALGARDVEMRALVLERLFQGPDHPVNAAFPDGLYLSTLIAEIDTL
jgi:23S rRNA (cytosine1962-C5)-methyltransferase